MPRLSLTSTVGAFFCSSIFSASVAPRSLTAAAARLKRASRGKIVRTRCRNSAMCCDASFIHVNAGRPSWKKPIPTAVARSKARRRRRAPVECGSKTTNG